MDKMSQKTCFHVHQGCYSTKRKLIEFCIELASQCVKGPFLVQKLQNLGKLEKWSIWIFVSKLTIFSGKTFEIFEFSRLNRSKIVIFGQFLVKIAIFGHKNSNN